MTSKRVLLTMIALALLAGAYWYVQFMQADEPIAKPDALAQTINECDLIAEKAAAHLTAVVEFQKLEIIGRKAAVFKRCMGDRGYQENSAWTVFAEPLAKARAKRENTSQDEAFENLRREAMKRLQTTQAEPVYWILKK